MFERISWLAEILNVVLCLHFLYGQRVKSKAATGILVVADWFVMEVTARLELKQVTICIVYVIIWLYIIVEFERDLKKAVVAYVFWIILTGLLQLIACVPWIAAGITRFTDFTVMIIQGEVLGILCVIRKKVHKLFMFVAGKNYITAAVMGGFAVYMIFQIVRYRINHEFPGEFFLPITIFGILISAFAYFWQWEKEQRQRKEIELRINNLCEASFKELIDTIRMKQHDFYNHIQTLRSQHYTIHTYEELVNEQEKYCEDIIYDNRYYGLLNTESPVISGFLYGKFMEADRQGIGIEYDVRLKRLITSVPEYVIIEMTGILWDNAVQYVETRDDRRIRISLKEYIHEPEVKMEITVENPGAR